MKKYNDVMKDQIKKVLKHGIVQNARNGNTLVIPSYSFTLDMSKAENRILTLRKMHYSGVKAEWDTLMDTSSPLTNVSQFKDKGCNYWDLWAKEDGSINLDYFNRLHPQLEDVIENINTDPHSRRHVISLWHHENVMDNSLSLTCCWDRLVFSVVGGTLHLTFSIRSNDLLLGQPADVYLAYLFMDHVSYLTGYNIGTCMFCISNLHIYEEHITNAKVLLTREDNNFNNPLSFKLKA